MIVFARALPRSTSASLAAQEVLDVPAHEIVLARGTVVPGAVEIDPDASVAQEVRDEVGGAPPAAQDVGAPAADEEVRADTAEQHVVAGAAFELFRRLERVQPLARMALEPIVAAAAEEAVRVAAPREQVVPPAAVRREQALARRVPPAPSTVASPRRRRG